MTGFRNDTEFRQAYSDLDEVSRRVVGAKFVKNVLPLCDDGRVNQAVTTALDPDASKEELLNAFKGAKAATIEARTRCGADCDWNDQAVHFVAKAAMALVAPEGQCKAEDPPWQVVMSSRMARNCALIAADDDSENPEKETQYKILAEHINS